MSEAIRTETAHPRRTVRSVAAVLAGIVVDVLLTIGTDLALRATRVFPPWGQPMIRSRADYSLFLDNQNQTPHRHSRPLHVSYRSPECSSHLWPQVSHKHLCEERSVDMEKPESGWGTTGEQLLPNKTLPARTPGFQPP